MFLLPVCTFNLDLQLITITHFLRMYYYFFKFYLYPNYWKMNNLSFKILLISFPHLSYLILIIITTVKIGYFVLPSDYLTFQFYLNNFNSILLTINSPSIFHQFIPILLNSYIPLILFLKITSIIYHNLPLIYLFLPL